MFADLAELDEVVLFIDEVEEIASARTGVATNPAHGVTNELLKLIPAFREGERRLMVCATNSVHSLDSAFLRPGRFDYVIPVGPPDEPARKAVWHRYLGASAAHVDLDRLVEASELFTPADIEFASRKGSQAAFEREVTERSGRPATTTTTSRRSPTPDRPSPPNCSPNSRRTARSSPRLWSAQFDAQQRIHRVREGTGRPASGPP